jgi:hypothetical protein
MAELKFDNVTIGNFMRALSKDRSRCQKMAEDLEFATQEFRRVLTLQPDEKIQVHLDEEKITHVIIPLQREMKEAEDKVADTGRGYPDSYVPSPLTEFNAQANPDKAFSFRVGEYTMRRCKG